MDTFEKVQGTAEQHAYEEIQKKLAEILAKLEIINNKIK